MRLPRIMNYGAFETRAERARAIAFDLCRYMRIDAADIVEAMSVYHWVYDQVAPAGGTVDLESLAKRWASRVNVCDENEWLQRAFR